MDKTLWRLRSFYLQIVLTILLFPLVLSADGRVGGIEPNDVNVEVNSEFEIVCNINKTRLNSNCEENEFDKGFRFEYQNHTRVPKEYIKVKNSTAIAFRMKTNSLMNERFTCYCNENAIDYAYIRVGTPPQNITDFGCLGYNFEYLVCNFTIPDNPIMTNQYLEYSVSDESYKYDCQLEFPQDSENKAYCNMTLDNSRSTYHQVHEHYNFTLKQNNSLGELTQRFFINQLDKMVPAKPNLILVNKTSNSLTFQWEYPRGQLFKKKGRTLAFDLRYLPELDKTIKKDEDFIPYDTRDIQELKGGMYIITLKNLEYAYTWYDIRMKVRVKSPKTPNTIWSESYNNTFGTSPRRPDNPPNTDIGSFYIDDSNRKVHLYWETLPTYRQNGNNTKYIVKTIYQNEQEVKLRPEKMALNSATFMYNKTIAYEFRIKSVNDEGESDKYNNIRIPKRNDKFKEGYFPLEFSKIFHNNSYELTWDEPKNNRELRDYTVFWCKAKAESHTDCEDSDGGSIHFKRIDKHQRNFTHSKNNHQYLLNFGVSANYGEFSSGMVWALCTAQKTGDFDEVEIHALKAEKQTIIISWNLNCAYRPLLEGYNLTYCPYIGWSEKDPNCTEPEKVVTIPKKAPGTYSLTNLKPYTSYKINMNMFSKNKSGPKLSSPKYVTTLEAAPSTPRNLKLVNKTSNYAVIEWDVPENKNGDIRYYEIFYDDQNAKLEKEKIPENQTTIQYRINHLKSYHNYKVYVSARTVVSSNPSNDIVFTTWKGKPDTLRDRSFSSEKDNVLIYWNKPDHPAADNTSFYRIVAQIEDNNKIHNVVSHVPTTKCTLKNVCKDVQILGAAINAIAKSEFDYETFLEKYPLQPFNHNRRRRSSDAEIDNDNDKPKYNHQYVNVYMNLKSEDVYASVREEHQTESRDQHHDTFNKEDFICKENMPDEILLKKYKDHEFLSGELKNIHNLSCKVRNENVVVNVAMTLGILTFLGVMSLTLYLAIKKFEKMKNIDFVLPPGLADLNQLDKPKSIQDNQNITKHQSVESLFNKINEKHCLLSSDNGSAEFIHCSESDKSDVNGYGLNGSTDPINNEDEHSSTQSGDSVELSDMSNDSNNSSPSQSPNVNELRAQRDNMNFNSPQTNPTTNSPMVINIGAPVIVDGYVQHSALQKQPLPPSLTGYTTLEALGIPTITTNPMPTTSIDTSNYVNPSSIGLVTKPKQNLASSHPQVNNPLAGYVTHKQLSEFGQQRLQ